MEQLTQWLKTLLPAAGERLAAAAVLLAVGLAIMRLVSVLVKKALTASRLEKGAHTLILSLCRVAMAVLLGLSVASTLGIDVTGIVALASVLTLALSLALQNILSNVIGGMTLLSMHPFRSGDYVQIADQSGTVQEVGMTYTKLATPDNKLISIPNSSVVAAQIINFSESGTRRVEVQVGVSYDEEPQKVIDALVLAGTMDNVLLEPTPFAAIDRFGDSAIHYTLRVWVRTPDYWDVYFELNSRIHRVFREQGITLTYPHMNVHLNQM